MRTKRFRKPYKIKRKKSILKNRFFWIGVLIIVISICLFYLICFLDFFQIEKIEIFGEQKVKTENIKNLIEKEISKKILFFPTKSIFLADLDNIQISILEEFPQITKVNLEREFPRVLKVEVIERKPVAVFVNTSQNFEDQNQDIFFFIDRAGIIYERVSEEITKDMFGIKNSGLGRESKLGEQIVEREKLAKILEIERKLKNDLKIQINSVEIVSEQRLNIKISEGWEIYFNLQKSLDWQLTELGLILEKKIPLEKREQLEYIDLRFDKIYYKYR
ncbi:hypothetical protein AMJ49_07350 [Parcubacteria bacterium DG_74_2]|nr:MAG: hypothetical protein AMJ49_07350 [Parcubacteria bacterium DG_74_2]